MELCCECATGMEKANATEVLWRERGELKDWVEKRAWFRGDGDGHDVGHGGDGGPRVRPWRRGKGRRVLVVVPGRHGLLRQPRVPAGGRGGGRQPGPEAHQQPDQQATAEGQASVQGDAQAAAAGGRGVGQIHHRQADADSARERLQRAREEAEDRGHQEEHSRCYKCKFFQLYTSSFSVPRFKFHKVTDNSKKHLWQTQLHWNSNTFSISKANCL